MFLRSHSVLSRDQMIAGFDITAAATETISAVGLPVLENPVRPPRYLSHVVYFQRPGCSERSFVMPFGISFDPGGLLDRVGTQGYRLRFYYLDGSWPVQDRVQLFLVWLKHAALSVTGSSPLVPIKLAIVRADPEACAVEETVDWQQIWDRARFEKAMAARKATPVDSTMAS